jgi:mannose-6-phosphate isomerase-like protein (cupin superfamily)
LVVIAEPQKDSQIYITERRISMAEEYAKVVDELEVDERPYLIGYHIFKRDHWEMAKVSLKPGAKMPLHAHEDGEQCYYILAGKGYLVMEGNSYELAPGMAAFIPMGVEHYTENPGDELFTYVEFRTTKQTKK